MERKKKKKDKGENIVTNVEGGLVAENSQRTHHSNEHD